MTSTRTDIHRPSALDPADYTDVGYIDAGGQDDPGDEWIMPEYASKGWFHTGWPLKCDHCGQRIRYAEVF